MEFDIDFAIERERVSRRAAVRLRRLIREVQQTDAATLTPEGWQARTVHAMQLAESSLEWGLATSRVLKSVLAASHDVGGYDPDRP